MEPKTIDTICIVGAGFMGAQIGLQCALHGILAKIRDLGLPLLRVERARREPNHSSERLAEGNL